jgi:peptidoglycan/LPS O-acetylase OafA/YrhL
VKHIKGLDGIRAYAVLMVVTTHMWLFVKLYWDKSPLYTLVDGTIGVQIFFILSGLLITHLLYSEHEKYGQINLKYFIFRRALRIFPVYYLMLTSLLILGLFLETMTTPKQLFLSAIYWSNHAHSGDYNITLGHTWSLAVEEHFYILWPPILMIMFRRKLTPSNQILLLTISIVLLHFLQKSLTENIFISGNFKVERWTTSAAIYLIAGCIGGILLHTNYWNLIQSKKWLSTVLGILFIMGFFVEFWYQDKDYFTKYLRIVGILAGILWIIVNQESFITRFLESKPIAYIGRISYGIYLWQGFFLATGPGRQNTQQWPLAAEIHFEALFNPGFILLCIAAPLSYHLFEVKFLKLKEKYRQLSTKCYDENAETELSSEE